MSIIPSASPTGQMGGGQFSPAWKELQPVMVVGAQVGFTVVSLVGVGKILKAARVISAADALLVRLYQSGKLPLIGGSTYYPPGWIGPGFTIAAGTISTWFTPDSSGGGGPGELPASTTPPPSIEETGGFIVDPPLVRDSSKYSARAPQCPYNFTGGRWHLGGWYTKTRRCTKTAGHGGRHRKPSWMRKR